MTTLRNISAVIIVSKLNFDGVDEKFSFTKIYLLVPIKYLYDNIVKKPSLGGLYEAIESDENVIISDSKLRELIPPQVQLFSK